MSWKTGLARLIGRDVDKGLSSYGTWDPYVRPAGTPPVTPGTKVPKADLDAARAVLADGRAFAAHCDGRILHAPGECWSCDLYPDWQKLRELWGIAFTGHQPEGDQLPCPADHARPPGSPADHRQWGPNTAQGGRS